MYVVNDGLILMSHGDGMRHDDDDPYYLEPREVVSQYSVEWIALRQSYGEVKAQLSTVQSQLTELDLKLQKGEIDDDAHVEQYRELWLTSTQIVQVKREVEGRLYEIQRDIRAANRKLKELEADRFRRERIEQEKSNAMIEWMGLKPGFDLIAEKRKEIALEMNKIELQRRNNEIADEDYRRLRVDQIRQLAQLRTVETDVKGRLNELLEIIRK